MELFDNLLNNNEKCEEIKKDDFIPAEGTEIIVDNNFSYDGYQVVRGEFFAHIYEPSITFNNCKVYLNTACIKKMPTMKYVQFYVNSDSMKLAVSPSHEDVKDSFLCCTEKDGKRKPKHITCKIFFAKIVDLMKWNPNYRYKMLGKIVKSNDGYLIVFDLKSAETYQRIEREGQKPKMSRTPIFPAEWQNQFGLPVEEHKRLQQINVFDGYTVFTMEKEDADKPNSSDDTQPIEENPTAVQPTNGTESSGFGTTNFTNNGGYNNGN